MRSAAAASLAANSSSASASLVPSEPAKASSRPPSRDNAARTSRCRAAISPSACSFLPMLSSGAQRVGKPSNQIAGGGKLAVGKAHARIGAVQFGRLLAARFSELHAKRFECAEKPGSTGPRTRSAQDRALERRNRARGVARADPQQRMLEEREQRHRSEFAKRRFGREPGEDTGRRIGERIAAGILRGDFPPFERGGDAARQRAIRRNERARSFPPPLPRAARPRWRAPRPRRWPPRSW